jgi:predicted small lipoprotein YifL
VTHFSRLFLILVALAALSACGRRGALEPPPKPGEVSAAPGQIVPGPTTAPVQDPAKSKPFILDPLLD